MDFSSSPPPPLELGATPEHYKPILSSYRYTQNAAVDSFNGKLDLGGINRFATFALTDDRVTGIELCTITPEDTFCGVPLKYRFKKFQKALLKAGLTSRYEDSGIYLNELPVSFFIEGGKPASIYWTEE